jgi:hypothetical protein
MIVETSVEPLKLVGATGLRLATRPVNASTFNPLRSD